MNRYRADLHVHTAASADGRSTLEQLTAAARRAGLDAIAITDHNRCTPVPPALNGVLLIPGVEVSTPVGHITGLFLDAPLDAAILSALPAPEEAVAAIRAAGGLAVLAHPFQRPGRTGEDYPFELDGVEAANARADLKVPRANELAARFARERALPPVGGSDAHHAGEVGHACTELEAESCTLPALRAALAGGACRAVLIQPTSHLSKGLSQWTQARRRGGIKPLARGALYLGVCLGRDARRALPVRPSAPAGPEGPET